VTCGARGVGRNAARVELDRSGASARLALVPSLGLLTLHPEPDRRSINGNVVTTDGVRPLALGWSATAALAIAGDAFGSAILLGGADAPTVVIGPRLDVVAGDSGPVLERDSRGIPILADARELLVESGGPASRSA